MHRTLEVIGCLDVLTMAIATRRQIDDAKELIHHSDRGIQYCSSAR